MSPLDEIRPADAADAFAHARRIRQAVFVEEQACPPDEEWDRFDDDDARGAACFHLLGLAEGRPVATSRWREAPLAYGTGVAKLERFAVLPEARGAGAGRAMVAATLDAARRAGYRRFVLHAQSHLQPFYESFGFVRAGAPFDEAGIEHVKMVLNEPPPPPSA